MSEMNPWLWAALALCIATALCMARCFRGSVEDRVAAFELAGAVLTLQMVMLVEGFARAPLYDLPLTLALLTFGGGMVFVHFVERWL